MKKSLLALAVSLAAVSGANAAWETGVTGDLVSGNGSMILSIWDATTQNSYSQDLGITFNQFLAGVSTTVALDNAALSVFGGNYGNVQYNVFVASNTTYTPDYTGSALNHAGLIYSLDQSQSPMSVADNYSELAAIWPRFNQYTQALGFDANPAANPVTSVSAGAQGYAGDALWSGWLEATLTRDLSGANGETLDLWLQGFQDADGFTQLQRMLGSVTLNLSGAGGSVTFATSEVPVPAAAWLMGSALLGLGSVARSRRCKA